MSVEYPAGYEHPIASVARYLLIKIVEKFAEYNVELPTRQIITVGSLAVDTPVLGIMYGGIAVGPPGNELNTPFRGDSPRTVTFNVELWRSTPAFGPGGSEPAADMVSSDAEKIMDDSWLLMEAVFQADQLHTGIIASITPNSPQGERHGVSMIVEIQIP